MAKYEIHPDHSDKVFLDLPRVYEDLSVAELNEVLSALEDFTGSVNRYRRTAERVLADDYKRGMEALAIVLKFHHEKTIARASIQVLAELTLRVYLAGDDGRFFINNYALEHTGIFSGFDTQAVIYLATAWENQLSE